MASPTAESSTTDHGGQVSGVADGGAKPSGSRGLRVLHPATRRAAEIVDRAVRHLSRHWLAIFNTLVAIFVLLPFLAPVLMHVGAAGPARLIYLVYRPTCHQLPDRSYFLFGPQLTYSVSQLEGLEVLPAGLGILQRELLRWPGSTATGFKVAFCERDVAIYGSILLGGLGFALLRRRQHRRGSRRTMPKLRLAYYALLVTPLVLDGGTQLVGWRESVWWLRSITGGLFGAATVALAYPYVDDSMNGLSDGSDGPSGPARD
jgi:uncharacterized membrane protein